LAADPGQLPEVADGDGPRRTERPELTSEGSQVRNLPRPQVSPAEPPEEINSQAGDRNERALRRWDCPRSPTSPPARTSYFRAAGVLAPPPHLALRAMSLGRVLLLGRSRIAPRSRVFRRRKALPIAPNDEDERRDQHHDERSERHRQTRRAIEATEVRARVRAVGRTGRRSGWRAHERG
jgi:hypothetical protein